MLVLKRSLQVILGLLVVIAVVGVVAYGQRYELGRWYFDLPPFEAAPGDVATYEVGMRDGTSLVTDVHLPKGDGPWPTILIRDPYAAGPIFCGVLVRYGYACVKQDTRGRSRSPGEWYPVIHERSDGLDTFAWILEQPWQDGNLATLGSSYVGFVQWSMVDEMPDEVKTIVADVSHGDWYEIVQRHGHFAQGVMTTWALGLHESEATVEEMAAHRPAVEGDLQHLKGDARWYRDYLTNPEKSGAYWSAPSYALPRDAHKSAHMPVLMSAGWHDFFLEGQLSAFEELPRREESLFIIRNGSHADRGDVGNPTEGIRRYVTLLLQWLAHHLKGTSPDALPRPGYVLQSNRDGRLETFETWPAPRATVELFLDALEAARSCDGGRFAEQAPVNPAAASYVYDPSNPVPSKGGSYILFGPGVVEQGSENCSREDVLSFASAPFHDGLTIDGSVTVAIQVASDADDSAFTVKLQEKLADGRVVNIRDDITSLRFRNGDLAGTYEPGSTIELVFDLVPIWWQLRPGSSLRLDVSSSNYPIYNAHPNVAEPWATTTESRAAEQSLFGGRVSIPIR